MEKAAKVLDDMGIPFEMNALSAHRTPAEVEAFAKPAAERGIEVIIAGAGMAAHLPGVIAAMTPVPVIGVPIIPGIKPLSTLRHLEILPETFGVKLPEELVREVKAHPDGVREVGTEWAIAQSRELMAAGVPVLHYYTMSRTTNIQKIVKAVF